MYQVRDVFIESERIFNMTHEHITGRKLTNLYLDVSIWREIKEIAKQEDRSANGLARRFLKEGLERYQSQEDKDRPAA